MCTASPFKPSVSLLQLGTPALSAAEPSALTGQNAVRAYSPSHQPSQPPALSQLLARAQGVLSSLAQPPPDQTSNTSDAHQAEDQIPESPQLDPPTATRIPTAESVSVSLDPTAENELQRTVDLPACHAQTEELSAVPSVAIPVDSSPMDATCSLPSAIAASVLKSSGEAAGIPVDSVRVENILETSSGLINTRSATLDSQADLHVPAKSGGLPAAADFQPPPPPLITALPEVDAMDKPFETVTCALPQDALPVDDVGAVSLPQAKPLHPAAMDLDPSPAQFPALGNNDFEIGQSVPLPQDCGSDTSTGYVSGDASDDAVAMVVSATPSLIITLADSQDISDVIPNENLHSGISTDPLSGSDPDSAIAVVDSSTLSPEGNLDTPSSIHGGGPMEFDDSTHVSVDTFSNAAVDPVDLQSDTAASVSQLADAPSYSPDTPAFSDSTSRAVDAPVSTTPSLCLENIATTAPPVTDGDSPLESIALLGNEPLAPNLARLLSGGDRPTHPHDCNADPQSNTSAPIKSEYEARNALRLGAIPGDNAICSDGVNIDDGMEDLHDAPADLVQADDVAYSHTAGDSTHFDPLDVEIEDLPPSSPPRSSSPFPLFSSSPPLEEGYITPPSSSQPLPDGDEDETKGVDSEPRELMDMDEIGQASEDQPAAESQPRAVALTDAVHALDEGAGDGERPAKRMVPCPFPHTLHKLISD